MRVWDTNMGCGRVMRVWDVYMRVWDVYMRV